MLAAVLWVICIVSQSRLVSVENGYISAAVIPYPFLCIIFDMVAEVYGYDQARKLLWFSCLLVYLFVLCVYIFSKLPAPNLLHSRIMAYNTTMGPLIRILFFNTISFIIGQYINIYFFSKMRLFFKGNFFGLRSISSTFIGDTITFAVSLFGDFSGLIKDHSIFVLVIDELIIMYVMAIILAPLASVIVTTLKNIEPKFNSGINFNPFK
jgi:uncharacterized integral membrane protein (TIGR00697 family)